MYIRLSEEVQDVFRTSSVRSVYVLCLRGNLTKFSQLEHHSKKCESDLQMFKHAVLESLGLQISGISREQTRLCKFP